MTVYYKHTCIQQHSPPPPTKKGTEGNQESPSDIQTLYIHLIKLDENDVFWGFNPLLKSQNYSKSLSPRTLDISLTRHALIQVAISLMIRLHWATKKLTTKAIQREQTSAKVNVSIHQTSEKREIKFIINDLDLPQNLMGSSLAHAPTPPTSVQISSVLFA